MFSHSETSPEYSNCDNKYGDCSEKDFSYTTQQPVANNIRYYINEVIIENKIKPKNMNYWFSELHRAQRINGLNLINTSNVTSMYATFAGLENSDITSLDLSTWKVEKVTDMSSMFHRCYCLESINLSGWRTSTSLTKMWSMFQTCKKLTLLDLSGFNTSNVISMRNLFAECYALESIQYSDNFVGTSLNSSGKEYMFSNCPANKPSWW